MLDILATIIIIIIIIIIALFALHCYLAIRLSS